jgi:putative nucleotidyltransferase with HDIG domain
MFTRDESLAFFKEYNKEEMHLKHALAVEAAMRGFAEHYGEDADYWGQVGLLHDIDWERSQSEDTHPKMGAEWLKEKGYPDDFVRAVLAHAWDISGVEPKSRMEKTLYAVDELTGFITAVALVRPSKSLSDLKVKSVKKKWKDKAFARGVNREVIEKGCELMGESLEELISKTIEFLRPVERDIGLGA